MQVHTLIVNKPEFSRRTSAATERVKKKARVEEEEASGRKSENRRGERRSEARERINRGIHKRDRSGERNSNKKSGGERRGEVWTGNTSEEGKMKRHD